MKTSGKINKTTIFHKYVRYQFQSHEEILMKISLKNESTFRAKIPKLNNNLAVHVE